MASELNRSAIVLNLAAFVGVSVFSISTDAPIIQQDILKRSEDQLLLHQVPIRGLAVSGRDVTLNGVMGSPITAPTVRVALKSLSGVRIVTTNILPAGTQSPSDPAYETNAANPVYPAHLAQAPFTPDAAATPLPPGSPLQRDTQAKIDLILENRGITFKNDSAALTPAGEATLDTIAAYLAAAPSLQCQIRGFDIETVESHRNWVLAFQRALATEDYLETKGISDWRLSTRAFHTGDSTDDRPATRAIDLVLRTRE